MGSEQSKPRKVLFVLPALTSGGAERVLITLMNNLNRDQFTPSLVVVSEKGELRDLVDPAITMKVLGGSNVILALPKMYSAIRAQQPDLVVSTMAHMNFSLLLLKSFFPKTRFIVREAITPSFLLQTHPLLAPLLKPAYKLLYARADLVISPAQAIIDEFKNDLNMACDNHKLLHNPVDLERIRAEENNTIELDANRAETVHFVAGGRLHSQKGYDRLITALPSLEMPYDWRLTIWGQGPERNALQRLIDDNGLSDKVTLAGHANSPWPHYAAADCFVMPSRWEGLPNVILESLACGTPAIATAQSGGIAEIQERVGGENINVVNNMDEFIKEMAKINPSPTPTFRALLLPDYFSKDAVVERFTQMLPL